MKILLVIDMQNAWLDNPASPKFDATAVIGRINHAASRIRNSGGQVIFVRHANDEAVAGSPAWNTIAALTVQAADIHVDKRACDPFADTLLAELLAAVPPGTLYISGFATEFCVDSAVRTAASRGFNVVVLSDAHTTSNRPHLPAESIIAHHNWVWANMAVPANATLVLQATEQVFPY